MNSGWAIVFATLFTFLTGNAALSQVQVGTAIFMQFTKTDLILAADSRSTIISPEGSVSYSDVQCKIGALNGQIVFAIAGVSRMDGPGGGDLLEIERTLASKADPRSIDDLRALANLWAAKVDPLFERAARVNPQWEWFPAPQNILTTAIFSGRDSDGQTMISVTNIRRIPYHPFGPATSIETEVVRHDGTQYAMFGAAAFGIDVMDELNTAASERAKANSELTHRIHLANSVSEMKVNTLKAVALAEQWYPDSVNGPIDQIYVGPGGVQWLHRKENCAEK